MSPCLQEKILWNFNCNKVIIRYVVKVLFYTFTTKGNTFVSLFLLYSFSSSLGFLQNLFLNLLLV